jgi:hypothetical protein
LQRKDEVANVDLVASAHDGGTGYASSVDIGTVRALLIHDDVAVILEVQSSMVLGHIALGQAELVDLQAADRDLGLVEVLMSLGSALFVDDDRKHRNALNAGRGASVKHWALFQLVLTV